MCGMRAWHKAALVPLLLAACSQPREPLPTVVLVTLDTTRADHLSTYGYGRETDPFLRELAARSRVFQIAVPTATWTLPSHASMFTGLDPAEHGCWMRPDPEEPGEVLYPALSPGLPTFTERLRSAGYYLVGAVGGPFTSEAYGFARDFHAFEGPAQTETRSAVDLNRWIFETLEERPPDSPLFLFVNYFDAHAPYWAPPGSYPFPRGPEGVPRELPGVPSLGRLALERLAPDEETVQLAVDQYDRSLLHLDRCLEELYGRLREEGLLERALVIVTSDHGESFGEHGTYSHGGLPREPLARVPLVIESLPGGPADRVAEPVSLRNLATTILAAAELPDLPPGGAGPGLDLLDLPPVLPPAYCEQRLPDLWVGVLRSERFKYGRTLSRLAGDPVELLLDLVADPGETGAVPGGGDALREAEHLRRELLELRSSWRPEPEAVAGPRLTAKQRETLRALGY